MIFCAVHIACGIHDKVNVQVVAVLMNGGQNLIFIFIVRNGFFCNFFDLTCGKYNGPLVKTTCRKKCVNQDLAILILSRPEPPLNRLDDRRASRREAGSLDRAAMACYNGRPRGCAHNHVLTSPHPRRHRLNRPAAFCQGRRKAARNKPDRCPPASHNPALRGAAGCCSR